MGIHDGDHYSVLGLSFEDELSQEQITQAYHDKAKVEHPDKNQGDPDAAAKFQYLLLSYNILSNPDTRKWYDDLLRLKRATCCARPTQSDDKREKGEHVDDAHQNEEAGSRKLNDEAAQVRYMQARKREWASIQTSATQCPKRYRSESEFQDYESSLLRKFQEFDRFVFHGYANQ